MEEYRWSLNEEIQKYINNEQNENLPCLENIVCANVKGQNINLIVLIDNEKRIIDIQQNNFLGKNLMYYKIDLLKLQLHFKHGKSQS
jgi:hypothetical protein